jgi:hypothetical protein
MLQYIFHSYNSNDDEKVEPFFIPMITTPKKKNILLYPHHSNLNATGGEGTDY